MTRNNNYRAQHIEGVYVLVSAIIAAICTLVSAIISYNAGQSNLETDLYNKNNELQSEIVLLREDKVKLESENSNLNNQLNVLKAKYDNVIEINSSLQSELGQYQDVPNIFNPDIDIPVSTSTAPTPMFEVVPAYEKQNYNEYTKKSGESFSMAGVKYNEGCTWVSGFYVDSYSLYNLNGEYNLIKGLIGHVDGSPIKEATIQIYLDGVLYEEITIAGSTYPYELEIVVTNINQLKIIRPGTSSDSSIGFANVTIE